jgi:hypothetical protein
MTDLVFQIGNSDNKLTQQDWSDFCKEVLALCDWFGHVHFSGGSATDSRWQNYCVCVSTDAATGLKNKVRECRNKYRQDSVAVLEGQTEFI